MSLPTLNKQLQASGISRRTFLKFCATTASLLALPQSAVAELANALGNAKRPSVIWLPFQECTGCTEAILRSHAPTLESLIFDHISLDYQHTIMAAAGEQAEEAGEGGSDASTAQGHAARHRETGGHAPSRRRGTPLPGS